MSDEFGMAVLYCLAKRELEILNHKLTPDQLGAILDRRYQESGSYLPPKKEDGQT